MKNSSLGPSVRLPVSLLVAILLFTGGSSFLLGRSSPDTTNSPAPSGGASQGTASCSNQALALKISYPANWECESKEINELNGAISLTSSLFKVELGNIGRASFCGAHPNDKKCTATPFYANDLVELSLQKYDGVNKEIFGVIKPDYSGRSTWTWIRATYQNMEERDLTSDEKKILTGVLFSIKITK